MDLEALAAVSQLVAVPIAAIAIIVSLKGIRDQLWLSMFSEYTRRFGEIMDGLPFEARRPGSEFRLSSLNLSEREHVLSVMRRYLNLCSEEHYLYRRGKVDRETWGIWQSGIRETTRFPCFQESWDALRCEYEYIPWFCDLIDKLAE
jgi:hypothetical protein